MRSISNLLLKNINKKFFNLEVKKELIKIIEDKIKIKLVSNNITIDGLNIKIQINPAVKTKIIINKKEILTLLKERLPNNFKNII